MAKKNHLSFDSIRPIDWNTDSASFIKDRILTDLSFFESCLEHEGMLCNITGHMVVDAFKFKGDYTTVMEQLKALIFDVKESVNFDNPENRQKFYTAFMRYSTFDQLTVNPYHEMSRDAVKRQDFMTMSKCGIKFDMRLKSLHMKKECLCYCNN